MKKITILVIAAVLAISAVFAASAEPHEHEWTKKIEYDFKKGVATEYLVCSCGAKQLVSEKTPRDYVGDVNTDGNISAVDYAMLKRHVLRTYTIPEGVRIVADINLDGDITAVDYAMLKRHILQTFDIYTQFDAKAAALAAGGTIGTETDEESREVSDVEIILPIIPF